MGPDGTLHMRSHGRWLGSGGEVRAGHDGFARALVRADVGSEVTRRYPHRLPQHRPRTQSIAGPRFGGWEEYLNRCVSGEPVWISIVVLLFLYAPHIAACDFCNLRHYFQRWLCAWMVGVTNELTVVVIATKML